MPADHNIKIVETVKFFPGTPGVQRYPLIVVCSCQYQSYAATPDIAEQIAKSHAARHGTTYTAPSVPTPSPIVHEPVANTVPVAGSAEKGVTKQG